MPFLGAERPDAKSIDESFATQNAGCFSKRGVDENKFDYFLGNDYFIII